MSRMVRMGCAWISMLVTGASVTAQPTDPGRVEIAWNRYYDTAEIHAHMRRIAEAYPGLVRVERIGTSLQVRELLVAVVNAERSGPAESKPAMWIDGNVHGNEIQAAEVVLYTLWSLARGEGSNPRITALLDHYAFHLMPVVNPDGRDHWFEQPNNPHTSRHNLRPDDDDRDGADDEDGPDDLDGDGHITTMWKSDPAGRWVRSRTDERIFERLRDDQTAAPGVATYTLLGDEGLDNDGDGRINEDGPFGDDMNRNWPGDWQPEHIQGGAGPFPLSAPETRAVAEYLLARPGIAAVQSYHNTGGMILRGPGAAFREGLYPAEDVRVYDELARTGEQMLPYYRYLVLFSGLYRVHGGFVTWGSEGLGAFSFTNELWTDAKYFQRDQWHPGEEQRWMWRDRVAFGALFAPYREFEHPQFGTVLVGGLNKWSSRITPGFMLEEECHRNFAFTMYHADQMPVLEFGRVEAAPVEGQSALWRIRAEVRNTRLMPTRSGLRRQQRIGWPDLVECVGPGGGPVVNGVVAANTFNDWLDRTPQPVLREPGRLLIDGGIPGRQTRVFEFVVEAEPGAAFTLRYVSAWARTIERRVTLPAAGAEAPAAPGER